MTGALKVQISPGVWETIAGQGPPGPPGSGGGGGSFFVHNQAVPSATWTITHDLSYNPNITVISSGGDVVEGGITYPTTAQVVLTFSASFSGSAYLS